MHHAAFFFLRGSDRLLGGRLTHLPEMLGSPLKRIVRAEVDWAPGIGQAKPEAFLSLHQKLIKTLALELNGRKLAKRPLVRYLRKVFQAEEAEAEAFANQLGRHLAEARRLARTSRDGTRLATKSPVMHKIVMALKDVAAASASSKRKVPRRPPKPKPHKHTHIIYKC